MLQLLSQILGELPFTILKKKKIVSDTRIFDGRNIKDVECKLVESNSGKAGNGKWKEDGTHYVLLM